MSLISIVHARSEKDSVLQSLLLIFDFFCYFSLCFRRVLSSCRLTTPQSYSESIPHKAILVNLFFCLCVFYGSSFLSNKLRCDHTPRTNTLPSPHTHAGTMAQSDPRVPLCRRPVLLLRALSSCESCLQCALLPFQPCLFCDVSTFLSFSFYTNTPPLSQSFSFCFTLSSTCSADANFDAAAACWARLGAAALCERVAGGGHCCPHNISLYPVQPVSLSKVGVVDIEEKECVYV